MKEIIKWFDKNITNVVFRDNWDVEVYYKNLNEKEIVKENVMRWIQSQWKSDLFDKILFINIDID